MSDLVDDKIMAEAIPEKVVVERIEKLSESGEPTNRLGQAQQMSDEEFLDAEKRLKRKLDVRLMATLLFIYILNYLDRNNIAAAKVAGIEKSLHMTSTQFSSAVSFLFTGYILMQVPSNMFLAKLRPSIYLPACMIVWGVISTCTGAVQSSGGLYATRFLLGVVEAAYYPGSLFVLSSWYKRSELGLRCAILYSGSQIGSAFSGLIGAGITEGLNGARGLAAWRWIFIIEGSLTAAVAFGAFFVLPDYPSNTRWLTDTERAVAEWRMIRDVGQVDEDSGSWSAGFKGAFIDCRLYVFAIIFHCILVTTSTQNFFPAVTLLLTVPPYAVGAVVCIFNNLSADKHQNSSFHIIWPLAVAITGFVIGSATLNTGARYFAMILITAGGHGANAVTVAWCQKTLIRPRMKRAAAVAFVNAFGNAAQVWAAYMYPNADAPRYVAAMSVNSGFAAVGICLTLFVRWVLLRENKRLATGTEVSAVMEGEVEQSIEGISEEERVKMRKSFRYIA
ncbi:hypothetical protein AC579_4089 [Pseudocercospora musae]|uniref:Major facilitator superfamily (MFS) profile domain-containing protein n=1 Tax=Pseudocercospora musae TaxID=113226 RepID=A0A139IJY8_9PEZI|nr:hypothetical protein AC579_4089 [Pseudocercospora musae]